MCLNFFFQLMVIDMLFDNKFQKKSFEMNGYGCKVLGNKLNKKFGGKMLSIQMLIFQVCN